MNRKLILFCMALVAVASYLVTLGVLTRDKGEREPAKSAAAQALIGAWQCVGGSVPSGVILRPDGSVGILEEPDYSQPISWRVRQEGAFEFVRYGDEGENSGYESTPYALGGKSLKLTAEVLGCREFRRVPMPKARL